MELNKLFDIPNEKPFDRIVDDGGFCGIFRRIACIGDSLSSGEFESMDENGNKGYHDMFEYSWGQYLARNVGCEVLNFSRGGMTAYEYCDSFANQNDFWSENKLCQAYIIALGVNDITCKGTDLGTAADIDKNNYENNVKSFMGSYAYIMQRIKSMQPKARFFLMTIPRSDADPQRAEAADRHSEIMYELADMFDYTYVLDFRRYATEYNEDFKKKFFLGGHMNPAGYILTARMVSSYIDFIIRHNMEDFAQIPFIGTPYHNCGAKW